MWTEINRHQRKKFSKTFIYCCLLSFVNHSVLAVVEILTFQFLLFLLTTLTPREPGSSASNTDFVICTNGQEIREKNSVGFHGRSGNILYVMLPSLNWFVIFNALKNWILPIFVCSTAHLFAVFLFVQVEIWIYDGVKILVRTDLSTTSQFSSFLLLPNAFSTHLSIKRAEKKIIFSLIAKQKF